MSIIPDPDRRWREREEAQAPSTYHNRTDPDLDVGGRFAKQEGARAQVIGQSGAPTYPAAAEYTLGPDAGVEPPLGYAIDEMVPLEPSNLSHQAQAPGGPPDAPSSTLTSSTFERGGPPPSSNADGADDAA